MKDKTVFTMSAVCAALLVVVIVLICILVDMNNNIRALNAKASDTEVPQEAIELQTQIPSAPLLNCNCENQGEMVEYKQYKSCNHEVICTMCDGRIRVEPCDFSEGSECMLCSGNGEHDGMYFPVSEMEHDFICTVCGLERSKEECEFSHGLCRYCDNECWHPESKVVSNDDGTHAERCVYCDAYGESFDCTYDDTGTCTECGYECYHEWSKEDGMCAKCGRRCVHNKGWYFGDFIDPATGKHTHRCNVCGKQEEVTTPDDGCACGAVKVA